jgi:hypothetical protein
MALTKYSEMHGEGISLKMTVKKYHQQNSFAILFMKFKSSISLNGESIFKNLLCNGTRDLKLGSRAQSGFQTCLLSPKSAPYAEKDLSVVLMEVLILLFVCLFCSATLGFELTASRWPGRSSTT